jgi:hypothetical protein
MGQDAQDIIARAVRSQPVLRYKGVRTVDVVVDGKPVRLVEIVSRDQDRSRTTYPADSPRKGFIIVESPRERWEYNASRNEVRRLPGHRLDHMMLRELMRSLVEGRVRAVAEEPESIAGRRTRRVKVADPQGNTMRRMWVDATGMILKSEQFGPRGRKLAGFVFTRIDLDPTFGYDEFERPGPKDARVVERPQDFDVEWRVRTPDWLPENFAEVGRGLRRLADRPVVMLHFSDGRKNFTVFQGQGSTPPDMGRESGRPGMADASRVFDGLWFVGVGRVEKSTLERVLKSIK